MKELGVNVGTCGVQTVRLRPMLIFEESHSKCPVSLFTKLATNSFF